MQRIKLAVCRALYAYAILAYLKGGSKVYGRAICLLVYGTAICLLVYSRKV